MSLLFLVVFVPLPLKQSLRSAQSITLNKQQSQQSGVIGSAHQLSFTACMGLSESRPPLCPHPHSDCPLLASIHAQEDFAKGIRQAAHWFQIKLAEDAARMLLSSRRLQSRRRPRL